jgi:hypothetical protein
MKHRWNLSDALAIAGGVAMTIGAGLWSFPAGLVVAGVLLCVAAIATAPKQKPRR